MSSNLSHWTAVGSSSESEIEEFRALRKRLPKTVLEAYSLMRGPSRGDLGPLYENERHNLQPGSDLRDGTLAGAPNPRFRQTTLPIRVTPKSPTFDHSTIGKPDFRSTDYYDLLHRNTNMIYPESQMTVDKASEGDPVIANPVLHGTDCFSGPYVLSKSEQSIVYTDFLDGEDDTEGDPRDFRISPETFARWAEGAVKIKQPEHEVIQPIQVRRGLRQRSREHAKLTVHIPQYCAESGDCMTPICSTEENPRPLLSPQGVDMDYLPLMFSRSYPLHALQFIRDGCLDAGVANSKPAPSGPERFTSECVREALSIEGRPGFGTYQMNEIKDYIYRLRKDCRDFAQEITAALKLRVDLEQEVEQLRVGAYLLRRRAANKAEQARKAAQRHRIKEHLGAYIEMLSHRRVTMDLTNKKLRRGNERLVEQREMLKADELTLQGTIAALVEGEELDSLYDTADDEQYV